MNVIVTSFTNPFSFFCVINNNDFDSLKNLEPSEKVLTDKITVSNADHGQYVAVMWRDKWVRGIISMEDQLLIWLVDFGMYLRPTEKTVYTKLPLEYKKYPSKIFEASLHGVVPISQSLNSNCQIENVVATKWTKASIMKAEELISSAIQIYFQPYALLSSRSNDVVLGDLFLQLKDKKIVNMIDLLEMWPVYLNRNTEVYIKDMPSYYKTRRRHHACIRKPVFPNTELPVISVQITLEEYNNICRSISPFELEFEYDSDSEDGTVLDVNGAYKKVEQPYKLTTEEIEKYSTMFITIHDREYNVLQILLNKIRDLNICEKYKDLKSVGRATSRRSNLF